MFLTARINEVGPNTPNIVSDFSFLFPRLLDTITEADNTGSSENSFTFTCRIQIRDCKKKRYKIDIYIMHLQSYVGGIHTGILFVCNCVDKSSHNKKFKKLKYDNSNAIRTILDSLESLQFVLK